MRHLAVDVDELVIAAASQVLYRDFSVINADVALRHLPDGVVEHQLRRVDVDIGLDAALRALVQQTAQVQVAVEVVLLGHAPCQVGVDAVVLAAGIQVEVDHAVLGGIARLHVQHDLVGNAVEFQQQPRLLNDLVGALHKQRGVNNQVKGGITLVQVALNNGPVGQLEGETEHLVEFIIGIDNEVEPHVVGQALMAVIGIVPEVLRESVRQQVLDRGKQRLEIILSRDKAADVVTVDADDLVIAAVVGIELQGAESQPLVIVVGKGEVIHLNVAGGVVQRVAPERGGSRCLQATVRVLVGEAQSRQIQAVGIDIHIIVGIGAVEQRLAVDPDAAVGIVHRQRAHEVVTLLVHVGRDVMIAHALEVNKGQVAL